MRQNQNIPSTSSRFKKGVIATTAFLVVSCSIVNNHILACNQSERSNDCDLDGTVRDYKGKYESIVMWENRVPRHASSLREITSRPVFELVLFLKRSQEFQTVLEKLESDRQQTYVRVNRKTYVVDPKGKYVRETGVAVWIPKDSSKLGIYKQRSGETYFYSNYGSSILRDMEARFEIKSLSHDVKFQLVIHTHPWGTVPSDHDQETARRGIISMVLSEKEGEPIAYVFSRAGSVWELSTKLIRSKPASEAPLLVAQN